MTDCLGSVRVHKLVRKYFCRYSFSYTVKLQWLFDDSNSFSSLKEILPIAKNIFRKVFFFISSWDVFCIQLLTPGALL